MKKLLTVFLCGLMACNDITNGNGLVISLQVGPTHIQPGTEMSIDIFVQNSTASPIQIVMDECIPYFEILKDGQVVGPAPRQCPDELPAPQTITTGAVVRVDDSWRGESSAQQNPTAPVYLTAGTYLLRPRAMLHTGEFTYGQAITVTILP